MIKRVNKSRILWACRRGMLELDILFMPFANECFDDLSHEDQVTFQRLLTHEDPDLFSWVMGYKTCPDAALVEIIDVILKRVKA